MSASPGDLDLSAARRRSRAGDPHREARRAARARLRRVHARAGLAHRRPHARRKATATLPRPAQARALPRGPADRYVKRSGSAACRCCHRAPPPAPAPRRPPRLPGAAAEPGRTMLNFVLREAERRPRRPAPRRSRSTGRRQRRRAHRPRRPGRQLVGRRRAASRRSDVSTPLMRDSAGRDRARPRSVPLDLPLGGAAGAGAHRAPVMAQYHDPAPCSSTSPPTSSRSAIERWLPALLEAANARVQPAITEAGGAALLRTRPAAVAADAAAAPRRPRVAAPVRRRPYPFLLPPPYRYGPPRSRTEERTMSVTTPTLPATNDEALRSDRPSTSLPTRRPRYRAVGMRPRAGPPRGRAHLGPRGTRLHQLPQLGRRVQLRPSPALRGRGADGRARGARHGRLAAALGAPGPGRGGAGAPAARAASRTRSSPPRGRRRSRWPASSRAR